jgi:predicted nucleic acid-binding protein
MSSFTVVLDACVLFPASLRDTLLRAANAELYRMRLTDEIIEEVSRNLIKKGMPEDKAQRLVTTIREQFIDAFVTQHRSTIASMPINEKDRHVLAAAVASNAQVIVTRNLKDFPRSLLAPFKIDAQSPDEFLAHLFSHNSSHMTDILIEQAANLHNPPMTVLDTLEVLMLHAPNFVQLVRKELGL